MDMEHRLHNKEVMKEMKGMEIPWRKSRETIWQEIEKDLDKQQVSGKRIQLNWIRYAAAAVILLIASGSFMRLYQVDIEALPGEQIAHQLPDGSSIELNSGSELSYHPLWWRFERKLSFEGEAFFMVQKGKNFEVKSALGTTEVLGTSFTIYSRQADYQVTCHTGKVRIRNPEGGEEVILEPNQSAKRVGVKLEKAEISVLPDPTPWKSQSFSFTAVPLHQVIAELERQYGVSIRLEANPSALYTGNINTQRPIEQSLHLVCKPFNFTFSKVANESYKIVD